MIAIIDYGMGNLGSISNMLGRIGVPAVVTSDPTIIRSADRLILPGVGAFDHAVKNLEARGITPVLHDRVLGQKTPILGICLGMQLLTKRSDEGELPGLGWLDGETVKFQFDDPNVKIPHMGWNTVELARTSPVFEGLEDGARFYFVHSYRVHCNNPEDVIATTNYGVTFHSCVGRENICGTQFHPEKSHRFGLRLLRNFAQEAP